MRQHEAADACAGGARDGRAEAQLRALRRIHIKE